jgi:hypothetical protein
MLLSRRLALLAISDQRRRNPLYQLPSSAYERRAILRALHQLAQQPGQTGQFCDALAVALSDHWAVSEHLLQMRGAMASISGGLARHASEVAKRVFHRDLFIEFGAAAQNVEWAGALGAHLIPEEGSGYSSAEVTAFLVALTTGGDRRPVATRAPRELTLAEELLAIDNDTNVFEFVTEIGKGDFARFGRVVGDFAGTGTDEEIAEKVRMWNAQVRHYERRPDRLRSFGVGGIVLAAASQFSPNETLRSAVPLLVPFMPLLVTQFSEELVRDSAIAGRLADWANGALAGAAPEAVLLSRMRKRVAGMKDPYK